MNDIDFLGTYFAKCVHFITTTTYLHLILQTKHKKHNSLKNKRKIKELLKNIKKTHHTRGFDFYPYGVEGILDPSVVIPK